MNIVVTFEPRGALYVQFRDAKVARTVELVKDALLVDLDEHGNVLGIEALRSGILSVTLGQISKTYHLPEEARLINFENLDKAFVMTSV
ncbi:MAG: DUF2283 domain-containing protein [Anaerolineae bacterium]|jgi:uncharacterized protein YuzE|nr:DUF2283 domain-containing protein [Anaerolineae bacterium]